MNSSAPLPAELETLEPQIRALLRAAGVAGETVLQPLAGGRNNRAFRVDAGPQRALLKRYFSHPQDDRDRLQSEFSFCRFCWDHDVRQPPQPLASDAAAGIALYEFVEGRALTAGEVTGGHVSAAVEFLAQLHRHKSLPAAAGLSRAAEACFSLEEHLQCIAGRVARLQNIEPRDAPHRDAQSFVHQQLAPAWKRIRAALAAAADQCQLDLQQPLAPDERCLSPSDFGFHNALLQADGTLRFIDFEYAGWDDPAKLVCDFFCQLEVPLAAAFRPEFLDAVAALDPRPRALRQRVGLLLPAYRLKWCCIVMNEFLPESRARRNFSGALDPASCQRQLQTAAGILQAIEAG